MTCTGRLHVVSQITVFDSEILISDFLTFSSYQMLIFWKGTIPVM